MVRVCLASGAKFKQVYKQSSHEHAVRVWGARITLYLLVAMWCKSQSLCHLALRVQSTVVHTQQVVGNLFRYASADFVHNVPFKALQDLMHVTSR